MAGIMDDFDPKFGQDFRAAQERVAPRQAGRRKPGEFARADRSRAKAEGFPGKHSRGL
jgi:hypothetical protein